MSDTTLNVLTFNTHLFGDVVRHLDPSVAFHDNDRFDALGKCLKNPDICSADIIAIQEMWSSYYVDHITQHTVTEIYPNFYYDLKSDGMVHASNPSGLLLMAKENITFDKANAVYYDYIHEIGAQHFDKSQDQITGKGYLSIPATINGKAFTLLTTHMPTNVGTYTYGVGECFKALASAVPKDGSPVLLMGDFNIYETKIDPLSSTSVTFYSEFIGPNGWLGKAGLTDGYRYLNTDATSAPGYSVIGTTNTTWEHFNKDKTSKHPPEYDLHRIDYIMYKGFTPVENSIQVQGKPNPLPPAPKTDYSDSGNQWVFTDPGDHETRDISDHYPLTGTLTLCQ